MEKWEKVLWTVFVVLNIVVILLIFLFFAPIICIDTFQGEGGSCTRDIVPALLYSGAFLVVSFIVFFIIWKVRKNKR